MLLWRSSRIKDASFPKIFNEERKTGDETGDEKIEPSNEPIDKEGEYGWIVKCLQRVIHWAEY